MSASGVILAAGRGSRMGGLTADRPKCLTPLAGRPLLSWQNAALAAAGVRRRLVVRGYLADRLSGDFETADNPRWAEGNMVVSLLCADPWLRETDCVVSYSDIVYHPSAVTALLAAGGDMAITCDRLWADLWRDRFAQPLADAETFRESGGRLVEIGGRAERMEDIAGQYMGLLRFTPAGWDRTRELLDGLPPDRVDRLDMTALLALLLARGQDIRVAPVDGRWCEVDSAEDLSLYERRIREAEATGRPWTHDWRFDAPSEDTHP